MRKIDEYKNIEIIVKRGRGGEGETKTNVSPRPVYVCNQQRETLWNRGMNEM